MLVKSWLREYLAQDTEAPRERLRARYYREPEMKRWLVYEIVAFLPLLLQIALGLFFVGLCFFTAAVNKRVGLTSLPLVAAWAFFLMITVVAPVFYPRCPWKVHALNGLTKAMRKGLRRLFSWLTSCLSDGLPHTETPNSGGRVEGRQDSADEDEEEVAIRMPDKDVRVLINADTVMADDSLIDAMGEVLKQRPERIWDENIQFVQSLILHRSGVLSKALAGLHVPTISRRTSFSVWRQVRRVLEPIHSAWRAATEFQGPVIISDFFPDLTTLSRKAYVSLLKVVADTIKDSLDNKGSGNGTEKWMQNATLLLLSDSCYVDSVELEDIIVTPMCVAMKGVLQDSGPVIAVEFVLRIIQRRFGPSTFPDTKCITTTIPDLNKIELRTAYAELMTIVAKAIQRGIPDPTATHLDQPWLASACVLLASNSQFSVPSAGSDEVITTVCAFWNVSTQTPASVIVRSVVRLIEHSRGENFEHAHELVSMPDLTKLSDRAYETLMGTTLLTFDRGRNSAPTHGDGGHWKKDASMLLAADPRAVSTVQLEAETMAALCQTIRDAFAQRSIDAPTSIEFVKHFIRNRLRISLMDDSNLGGLSGLLDLTAIPFQVYTLLMTTLSDALRLASGSDIVNDRFLKAAKDASVLLLSKSEFANRINIDDELLTIMCTAAKHAKLDQAETVTFIRILINRRKLFTSTSQAVLPELDHVLELDDLSEEAYGALLDTVATSMQGASDELYSPCLQESSEDSFINATIILLSKTSESYSMPESAINALRSSLDDASAPTHSAVVLANRLRSYMTRPEKEFIPLSLPISRAYASDTLETSQQRLNLAGVLKMYQTFLLDKLGLSQADLLSSALVNILRTHPEMFVPPRDRSFRPILNDMLSFIHAALLKEGDGGYDALRLGTTHSLIILLEFSKRLGREQDAVDVFTNFWSSDAQGSSYFVVLRFAGASSRTRAADDEIWSIVRQSFIQADAASMSTASSFDIHMLTLLFVARRAVLTQSKAIARDFTADKFVTVWTVHLDMVRFCYVYLQLYQQFLAPPDTQTTENQAKRQPSSGDVDHGPGSAPVGKELSGGENVESLDLTEEDWRSLWEELNQAIRRYWNRRAWNIEYISRDWHDAERPEPSGSAVLKQDSDLAAKCLELMQALESNGKKGETARIITQAVAKAGQATGVNPTTSTPTSFPDGLVLALGNFIEDKDLAKYPRLAEAKDRNSARQSKGRSRNKKGAQMGNDTTTSSNSPTDIGIVHVGDDGPTKSVNNVLLPEPEAPKALYTYSR